MLHLCPPTFRPPFPCSLTADPVQMKFTFYLKMALNGEGEKPTQFWVSYLKRNHFYNSPIQFFFQFIDSDFSSINT